MTNLHTINHHKVNKVSHSIHQHVQRSFASKMSVERQRNAKRGLSLELSSSKNVKVI